MSKIPYDLTKIRAIAFDVDGVLSPSTVPMSPDGVPQRMANLKDGYSMVVAVKKGLKMAIISGADTPAVRNRFNIIGITDVFLGSLDKLDIFRDWMKKNGLTPDEVAFVGDDIPDIEPMLECGLPVAPADAVADVKKVARYITSASGGYGVARELIEQIMKAQNTWPATHSATGI